MGSGLSVISIDLGAESGRVFQVEFSDKEIVLEEIHRFRNGPINIMNRLHWDVGGLFRNVKEGLSLCHQKGFKPSSIGLDTWGVDFALLDTDGELLGLPFHYRDGRTDGMLEKAYALVPREEIFDRTGIQFMQINTLYQLLSMKSSPQLKIAHTFLMMPDLLNYWLCGEKVCEFTDATTTQIYDQRSKQWAYGILEKMGLPTDIFPQVMLPGTVLGNLLPWVVSETGMDRVPVILPACHDTGSAVAAVPAQKGKFAYISSGTWSLVGVEVRAPIINNQSLAFNFTNEGGVAGTVRLLKNVTGLWLIQECRRVWEQQGKAYSYAEMAQMAATAKPFVSYIDPDAKEFLRPTDMPLAIQMYCSNTGQVVPQTPEEILRCIFESLVLKYRYVLECLEQLTGDQIEIIHVIGGGSQNELLNQFTADATGKPLIAGPVEATALGNAMVQATALGFFESVAQGREAISRGIPLREYYPQGNSGWEDAYIKFRQKFIDSE